MQCILTKIQNGCHSAPVSRINLNLVVRPVIHNPTRFHKNCFKTSCEIVKACGQLPIRYSWTYFAIC